MGRNWITTISAILFHMLKQWATPINRRQSNATAINFDGIAVGRGWWEREREIERERGGR